MTPCERSQTDIEKRLNQSLSAEEGEQLEEHLQSCELCRDFSHKTKEIDAMFHATTQQQLSQIDPGQLEQKVWASLHASHQLPFRVGVSYLLLLPVVWFWLEYSALEMAIYSAVTLLVFGIAIAISRSRAESILRLIDLKEAFVPFQRRQLEKSISVHRLTQVVYPIGGLLNITSALWWQENANFAVFQFVLGLAFLVLGWLAYRRLNQLKRERGALD